LRSTFFPTFRTPCPLCSRLIFLSFSRFPEYLWVYFHRRCFLPPKSVSGGPLYRAGPSPSKGNFAPTDLHVDGSIQIPSQGPGAGSHSRRTPSPFALFSRAPTPWSVDLRHAAYAGASAPYQYFEVPFLEVLSEERAFIISVAAPAPFVLDSPIFPKEWYLTIP